ncbi:MAG: ABC transporter permease [Firmicutes bacterium]|nr:ABC transporter permease [Bacillota bacterium]
MKTLRELYLYRHMIKSMVKKDLRGRYKGSVLGFLWTFVNPLLQLVVYTFVFSVILKNGIEKFYLYLFVALVPWIFFSSSVTGGSVCIFAQKDLVKKIYFCRQVIPVSYVTSCFVNMLFTFVIIFAVLIISGATLNPAAIACLPVIMITEYILALGMALIAASLDVYFRDLQHILGILMMAWMYCTPIMYKVEVVPEKFMPLFNLNPMTPIITAYRDVLYYAKVPQLQTIVHALVLGVIVLVVGNFIFDKLQRHFAEEL